MAKLQFRMGPCLRLLAPALIMVLLFGAPPTHAQSDLRTRNQVDLFQDMQADTVTSDLFNNFAPTPHVKFHVTVPVPGLDLTGNGQGCVVIDFNHDAFPDVLKCNVDYGGEDPSVLLRGMGDGTFQVAKETGLPVGMSIPMVADLDGDGWEDLVVKVNRGSQRRAKRDHLVLDWAGESWLGVYRNDGGRAFQDMTTRWLPAVISEPDFTCLVDLDQDGHLDLIYSWDTESVPGEVVLLPGSSAGFQQEIIIPFPEDWYFQNVGRLPRVSVFDLDDDGDQDLLIQEPQFFPRRPRRLMVAFNEDGVLQPWQLAPFPQVSRHSSLSWVDVDNDGDFDAYAGVSDFEGGRNQMYMNQGQANFVDMGKAMGLWAGYNHSSGGCWADLDNDGFQDFLQGREFAESAYTDPALFLNDQGNRFLNITATADKALGPSMVFAVAVDVDQDGDQDFLYDHISHYSESAPLEKTGMKLLRNDSQAGEWLRVKLAGTWSNRSALGGRAMIFTAHGIQHQQVANGMFTGVNQPSLVMHFGLGAATQVDSVVVRWPDGQSEWWPQQMSGQTVVLTEGEGESRSGK